jgi:hypothetical protein
MGKTRSVEGTLSVVRTSTVTVVVAKIGTPRRVLTLDIVAVAAFAVLKLLVSASDVGPVLVVGAAGLGLRDVDGLLAAGLLHVYVVVADLVSLVVDNWSWTNVTASLSPYVEASHERKLLLGDALSWSNRQTTILVRSISDLTSKTSHVSTLTGDVVQNSVVHADRQIYQIRVIDDVIEVYDRGDVVVAFSLAAN